MNDPLATGEKKVVYDAGVWFVVNSVGVRISPLFNGPATANEWLSERSAKFTRSSPRGTPEDAERFFCPECGEYVNGPETRCHGARPERDVA